MTLFYLFESTLRKSNSHAFQSLYFVFFWFCQIESHAGSKNAHTKKQRMVVITGAICMKMDYLCCVKSTQSMAFWRMYSSSNQFCEKKEYFNTH